MHQLTAPVEFSTLQPFEGLTLSQRSLQQASSNVMNMTSEQCPGLTERLTRSSSLTAIFIAAYSAIFVCGVVANILVIGIVACKRSLQTNTNFFIINLAVADLLVLICVLPITLLTTIFTGRLQQLTSHTLSQVHVYT